ncbi:hypothetical protein DYB32_001597 [Aphanomyces invadans]|uniref:Uncharacterized protein n=1 Tax=Aphanomyces invadans TaxID=157072 RepID=A0A418B5P1_9STRA|nr:hypothetical protein DYB32_001597 [Aphanomyces invadans]
MKDQGSSLPKLLARIAPILTGDATAQTAILTALVDQLALFDAAAFNAATTGVSSSSAGSLSTDLGLALHRMGTVVVNDMLTATFSSLCFLTFLDDAQPSFVAPATLQHISVSLLPRGLALLRTWVFYQWLFGQPSSGTQAMLVQDFAKDTDVDIAVPSLVSDNLTAAVLSLLWKVRDLPALASYVHSTKQHDVLRIVARYALQRPKENITETEVRTDMYLARLLGDAMVAEAAVASEHNDESGITHALTRSIRSYMTVLDLEAQQLIHSHTTDAPLATQLYDITTHLKESVPRQFAAKFILQFLRMALVHVGGNLAAAEFVWYNVFKLALTEHLYDEAHVALQHIMRGADASTVDDCVRHFVLHLCDAWRLDIVVGFSWGALEAKVEDVLQWQAANTHANLTIKRTSQSAVSVLRLLYSFFVKRGRFTAASKAMHALFVRLEPEAINADVLQTQRDALFAATNVLTLVPEPHRWFVTQELASDATMKPADLQVVTVADLHRELVVIRGKLLLSDSVPSVTLAGQSGSEVVSLLLKHLTPESMAKSVALAVEIARVHDLDVKVVVRAVARDFAFSRGSEVHLQMLLRHVSSSEAYLAAISTLLHLHAPLPQWLTRATVASGSLAVVALLRLYLDYGVLEEAVALAIDHLIPNNVSEKTFKMAAASDISPKWMPYDLLDRLLDACDAIINEAEDGVAVLQCNSSRLKHQLTEYFKYVKSVDAAATIRRQHELCSAQSNPLASSPPWSAN